MQDGLGDTIRVSLTEPPEEEIDPCRRMANLGTRAADLQQGVVGFSISFDQCLCRVIEIIFTLLVEYFYQQAPFEEKHRHYFDFQRRSGQLPMQKEVCPYRELILHSPNFRLYCFVNQRIISSLSQGEEVDYRGVLHRDGSVLMSVFLDQLKVAAWKLLFPHFFPLFSRRIL